MKVSKNGDIVSEVSKDDSVESEVSEDDSVELEVFVKLSRSPSDC